ncbi:MAG: ABC transporter ATP-binding protein [Paenibacillus dendritiformis]|uniref:ABC transporter ATP-binding protein n=1 Tax=Paenibacillus dendritiformis TaxID=130049 RepID=UPI00143D2D64|nr:ABC transporter ATP-binding protein [Paenibacillus dendritiformis]MDU5145670.1 ABC transporter ATP-binding protein [Paenibacillus dendritiformis]NKI21559.1 ABC transporter ATP-binding protein [Paenibacillus dendritiformis]NRF96392.1 ABC transporter ATP-binding protein [Paenibacillus dendritiformis]GIO73998.1 dipeptide/oligopeptide/nickel ABC transporter ATP-binding protein [Paenibacillus dendritiformis]
MSPIIEVKKLSISFQTDVGVVPVVNSVSFHLDPGEILGIVGESGCGKSVTSLSLMGLIPARTGKVSGEIEFKGETLPIFSEAKMRKIRGNNISMIFQEPMTSLNPLFTIGDQLTESLRIHKKADKKRAKARAVEIMKQVGLGRAEALMNEYPHQLSGGMRQRVMIAMAMMCEPELLIADEPTTALDVTIQAQILELMKKLNQDTKTAIMMITHDLGVVADMCQRMAVMYAGKIVEEGEVRTIFQHPKHPYTIGLIQSVPDMRAKKKRLYSIPGQVPKPGSHRQGCSFAPRCAHAAERCVSEEPSLQSFDNGQKVSCWLYEDGKGAGLHDSAISSS